MPEDFEFKAEQSGTLGDLLSAQANAATIAEQSAANPAVETPPAEQPPIENSGGQKTQAELDAEAALAAEGGNQEGNPESGTAEAPVIPDTVNHWERFSEEAGIPVKSKAEFDAYMAQVRETERTAAIKNNPKVNPILQAVNELIGDTTGKEPAEVIGMLQQVISDATTDYPAIAASNPEAMIQAGMLDGNSYMTEASVKIAIEDLKDSYIAKGKSKDLEGEELSNFVSERMKIKALEFVPKLKSKQVDLAAKALELAEKSPEQVNSAPGIEAQKPAFIAGMNEFLANTKTLEIGGEAGDWGLNIWGEDKLIKPEYHPLLERLSESPYSFFNQYINDDGTINVAKVLETELKLHELPKMIGAKTKEAVVEGQASVLKGLRNPGTAAATPAPVKKTLTKEEEMQEIAKSLGSIHT